MNNRDDEYWTKVIESLGELKETDAALPKHLTEAGEKHRNYLIAYLRARLRDHREAFSVRVPKRNRFWRQSPDHTSIMWRLLLDLYEHETTSYAEMQREVRCSPTKLKEILNEAERLQLIVLEQDSEDNRRRIIRPTWACMHEWERRHFARLQRQSKESIHPIGEEVINAYEEFCDVMDTFYLRMLNGPEDHTTE